MIKIIVSILIAIIVLTLLWGIMKCVPHILKNTACSAKGKDLRCVFHGRIVKIPLLNDLSKSRYFNRYPAKKDSRLCATIDDECMLGISKGIQEFTAGKSDRFKAEFILTLVQQNVRYTRDYNGDIVSDRWQFPVCTAHTRKGDCEDGAFLGVNLCTACGLDAIAIYVKGHMAYGVNVPGKGTRINVGNKSYVWCETTSVNNMGVYSGTMADLAVFSPITPPDNYIETQTYTRSFDD